MIKILALIISVLIASSVVAAADVATNTQQKAYIENQLANLQIEQRAVTAERILLQQALDRINEAILKEQQQKKEIPAITPEIKK